eukprot:353436-Chlamydomonas_euryale.AAC.20
MVLISHWLACIWYMLYKFGPSSPLDEWAFDMFSDNVYALYVSSYYQVFLSVMGDNITPLNDSERIFFIFVSIGGTCFYSAMLGQMALLVANLNVVASRHKQRSDISMEVLRYMGIPDADVKRVEEYFMYITQFNHPTTEGMGLLQELPQALYREMATELYKESLSKIGMFAGVEEPFLTAVSLRMRMSMFTPRETIFKAGDLGREMYIIRKGSIAVVGAHRQMVSLLTTGSTFGQFALLTPGAKRTADAVALSHCDLCTLSAPDLRELMRDYPKSGRKVEDNIARELHMNQVAGRGVFNGHESDDDVSEAGFGGSDSGRRAASLDNANSAAEWVRTDGFASSNADAALRLSTDGGPSTQPSGEVPGGGGRRRSKPMSITQALQKKTPLPLATQPIAEGNEDSFVDDGIVAPPLPPRLPPACAPGGGSDIVLPPLPPARGPGGSNEHRTRRSSLTYRGSAIEDDLAGEQRRTGGGKRGLAPHMAVPLSMTGGTWRARWQRGGAGDWGK